MLSDYDLLKAVMVCVLLGIGASAVLWILLRLGG